MVLSESPHKYSVFPKGDQFAAVIGATGQTGKYIVDKLLRQNIPVRVLTRNPAKTKKLFGEQVEIIEGDLLTAKELKTLVNGISHVLAAQGADNEPQENAYELIDFGGMKKVVESIPKGQQTHIIYMSSIYVERSNPPVDPPGRPLYWKRKAELLIEKSGHPFTLVRPGWLNNKEGGQLNIIAEQGDKGDGKICREDVAEVMVQAMHVESAKRKVFEVFNIAGNVVNDWEKFFAGIS